MNGALAGTMALILTVAPCTALEQEIIASDSGQPGGTAAETSAAPPDEIEWDAGTGDRQPRLAVSARLGYGIRIGGARYIAATDDESREFGSDGVLKEVTDHYLNYGQGLKVEAAADLSLMENVAAEFALCFTGKVPRTVISKDSSADAWEETFRQASFGGKLLLVPRFRIVELIDVNVGFGAGILFTTCTVTNDNDAIGSEEGSIKTRPGFLFTARLGAEYPLSDMIAITLDISTEQVSFTLKEYCTTNANSPVYEAERGRSSSSNDIVRPEKFPGTNVAIRLGTRFVIF
ncbi:MAG: hypothetical protein GF418_06330 [Chitinivibrionales bacterium]|nr:hypothetical protein [Chitinivibrionales bacterium]MBD3395228.1 hypothetical protein [Chitinivibrionales bacterium]